MGFVPPFWLCDCEAVEALRALVFRPVKWGPVSLGEVMYVECRVRCLPACDPSAVHGARPLSGHTFHAAQCPASAAIRDRGGMRAVESSCVLWFLS